MSREFSRRKMLAGAAGLAGTALGAAGCGVPFLAGVAGEGPARSSLTFWNLFSGPAAVHMDAMQAAYEKSHPRVGLSAVHLSWGNPYYTKLALATLGHRPPDVAISHISRVPTLARAGLLEPYDTADLAHRGIDAGKFTTAAWRQAHIDGKLYALPLDTHPFVLYYRTDVCRKAGLLDHNGQLVQLKGRDDFVRALAAAKKVTGSYGGVTSINADPATNWRWFSTLYGQLGGQVIADEGRKVVLDTDKATTALEFMRELTVGRKLLPADLAAAGAVTLFSTGKAGFLLDGVWSINTYLTAKTPFDMTPLPNFFGGKYSCWADSHTFVLPKDPDRNATRRDLDLTFIKFLLDSSLTWGAGGLIPAWRPVQDSAAYHRLSPQSHTLPAAYAAKYDPPAWYSGAGSDFENIVGAAVAAAQTGQASPRTALAQMRSGLRTYAHTAAPVNTG